MKRDYYDVLGVRRDAGQDEIKKAFRRVARECHPDVNPGDPDCEAQFKEAAEAYEVLSDTDSRAVYDRYGFDGLKGRTMTDFDHVGFNDLFNVFFGGGMFDSVLRDAGGMWGAAGGGAPQPRGDDVEARLHLTLAESVFGASREVEVTADATCDTCGGSGARPGTGRDTCPQCHGSGRMREVSSLGGFGQFIRTSTCSVCRGQGTIVQDPCETCRGAGRLRTTRSVTVDVPAGIADGQRLRLGGEGGAGAQGGRAGDLYVAITVEPHEDLVRDGNDLVYRLDVTMIDAALGTKVYVPGPRRRGRGGGQARHAAGRGQEVPQPGRAGSAGPRPRRPPGRDQRPGAASPRREAARGARAVRGAHGQRQLRARPELLRQGPGRLSPVTSGGYTRYTLRLPRAAAATASAPDVEPLPDDWSGSAAFAVGADPVDYAHPDAVALVASLQPAGWQEEDGGDTLVFWLAGDAGSGLEARGVLARLGGLGELVAEPQEPGWETAWQEFHRPQTIGRFYVRPPWHEARHGLLDLVIDAGQAFGTGGHATTRQCLEEIEAVTPGIAAGHRLRLGRRRAGRAPARVRAGLGRRHRCRGGARRGGER